MTCLYVLVRVSYLATPILQDLSDGHTVVGQTLVLKCTVEATNIVFFYWETPNGPVNVSILSLITVILVLGVYR